MESPIILKDVYTIAPFVAAFIILIIGFSMAYVNLGDNNNLLIIHFDSFKGIDFLGNRSDIYDILLSAIIVLILNMGLAQVLYFRERFLSYFLSFGTLLFSVLILIAVNVIITVN